MSKGKLDVEAIGRLGRDPDTSVLPTGIKITKFSIAVDRKFKGEDDTTWINVVAFDRVAEIASQYLRKGHKVSISGALRIRKYQGRDDLEKTDVSITARDLILLENKRDAAESQYREQSDNGDPGPVGSVDKDITDEELPF